MSRLRSLLTPVLSSGTAVLATVVLATGLCLPGCGSAPPPVYEAPIGQDRGFFVIYGDSRPRILSEMGREDTSQSRLALLNRLTELRPDFALHSGDMVANGADGGDWEQLDRETYMLRSRGVPFYAGLGDQDLMGGEDMAMTHVVRRFPSLSGSRRYTLDHEGIRIVVVDTSVRSKSGPEQEAEAAWFAETLDAAEKDPAVRDVIVVSHHPPCTNEVDHESSPWVRAAFLDPARAHPKVHAFVSGGSHTYERFRSAGIDCIVSGGGGAPLVPLVKERPIYTDLYQGPRKHHFLIVRPGTPATIEVEMLTSKGKWEVVDKVVLGAPPGAPRASGGTPGN